MTIFSSIFGISADKGAETTIYLATSPEVESVTGEYFDNKQIKKTHAFAQNEAAQKRLWELSEQLTGGGDQGVR